ncbi:IclR family transcriptional regulator C-terminal domain-containing protein [Streptomyces sp. NPDC056519]|uniref:IclR family transcriptional regulator domain-containing protein n=1 Tax=Streptomyces sp. NPDC056519 TaxID=3345849 RepID=UPI0036857998
MPFPEVAHASAVGKSLLAQLDFAGRMDHLARYKPRALTGRTITDPRQLFTELDVHGPHAGQFDLLEYSDKEVCAAFPWPSPAAPRASPCPCPPAPTPGLWTPPTSSPRTPPAFTWRSSSPPPPTTPPPAEPPRPSLAPGPGEGEPPSHCPDRPPQGGEGGWQLAYRTAAPFPGRTQVPDSSAGPPSGSMAAARAPPPPVPSWRPQGKTSNAAPVGGSGKVQALCCVSRAGGG